MKINFDAKMYGIDGSALKEPNSEKEITLGDMAVKALFADFPDEKPDWREKGKKFDLGLKIQKGIVDLESEDISFIKNAVGKAWPTLLTGQATRYLEGQSNPLAPKETE